MSGCVTPDASSDESAAIEWTWKGPAANATCCTDVKMVCEKRKMVLLELLGWATYHGIVSIVRNGAERRRTCSTRSPLQTTTVGMDSWRSLNSPSSSRRVKSGSSRYLGTTNSNSQVHFSQRLSTQGTQHLAASGEEGMVYA